VVDPGFAKQKVFNPKTGVDALVVAPISQASGEPEKSPISPIKEPCINHKRLYITHKRDLYHLKKEPYWHFCCAQGSQKHLVTRAI